MLIKKTITLIAVLLLGVVAVVAQDMSKYGETEEEQQKCLEALQLYRIPRDAGEDHMAYVAWQTAMADCPCTASERMFSDGTKFLKNEIKVAAKAEDKDRANLLSDSLFVVYDMRADCYPDSKKYPDGKNACNIKGRKVLDMMKLKRIEDADAMQQLKEINECMGAQTNPSFASEYYVLLYAAYDAAKEAGDAEKEAEYKERLILEYITLSGFLNEAKGNTEKEKEIGRIDKALGNLDEIFVFVASCEDMVPVLKKKIDENPDDMELKEKALGLMNLKDCAETDLDFYLEVAEAVCQTNKTAECTFSIGIGYLKKSDLNTAYEYLEEAATLGEGTENEERYYLRAGQVAANLGKCSTAMSYANKILAKNANSGEAYLLKGDAAACSVNSCDDGRLGRYCAYWVAVDYYGRAKSIDSSVADKANKKIANASKGYPSIEDVFSTGKKEGDSFDCGCLGTSTKIRVR